MAVVQKGATGFGVIWSVDLSYGTGFGIGANASWKTQSADLRKEAGIYSEFRDPSTGDTSLVVIGDITRSITIEVIPSGNTIAYAKENANILPDPGTLCTLTDNFETSGTDIDNGSGTTWVCRSASKRYTNNGELRITMELTRYAATLAAIT